LVDELLEGFVIFRYLNGTMEADEWKVVNFAFFKPGGKFSLI
jgi:hypothetical protein